MMLFYQTNECIMYNWLFVNKNMKKQESFENDELNTAFMDEDLMRGSSVYHANSTWNILDHLEESRGEDPRDEYTKILTNSIWEAEEVNIKGK